ncbi:uncharacterized protein CLUP02_13612 [Colletotrichum lupini]|uniref:Uncharacterized protein n=1 Tax=Colletotrichum lupini TaxID=145971 RepID=A0A9Q8T3F5_9PEZI|nr:uncharacterized protein CLUP02_13612 [Colletotrichum lupini]UQC88090.1 hypothetical protein CLUP02_13612 [Colletotrichum lupini]
MLHSKIWNKGLALFLQRVQKVLTVLRVAMHLIQSTRPMRPLPEVSELQTQGTSAALQLTAPTKIGTQTTACFSCLFHLQRAEAIPVDHFLFFPCLFRVSSTNTWLATVRLAQPLFSFPIWPCRAAAGHKGLVIYSIGHRWRRLPPDGRRRWIQEWNRQGTYLMPNQKCKCFAKCTPCAKHPGLFCRGWSREYTRFQPTLEHRPTPKSHIRDLNERWQYPTVMGIGHHDPGHHLSFQTDRSLGKRNGPPSTDVREAQAWTSGRRLEEQNATRLETRTSGPYGVHSTQHAMNNEYLTGPSFPVFCSVFSVRGSTKTNSKQESATAQKLESKSCSWYSQFCFLIRLDHPHLNCREIVTYASELNALEPSICKPNPGISTIGSSSLPAAGGGREISANGFSPVQSWLSMLRLNLTALAQPPRFLRQLERAIILKTHQTYQPPISRLLPLFAISHTSVTNVQTCSVSPAPAVHVVQTMHPQTLVRLHVHTSTRFSCSAISDDVDDDYDYEPAPRAPSSLRQKANRRNGGTTIWQRLTKHKQASRQACHFSERFISSLQRSSLNHSLVPTPTFGGHEG